MKLYLHSGRYYEKQGDCPDRKFETVEFPFAASPKADFVAWMNENRHADYYQVTSEAVPERLDAANQTLLDIDGPLPVDEHVAREAAKPKPAPRDHFDANHPLTTMAIEDWCAEAQPHQLGTVIAASAARLQQISQQQQRSGK